MLLIFCGGGVIVFIANINMWAGNQKLGRSDEAFQIGLCMSSEIKLAAIACTVKHWEVTREAGAWCVYKNCDLGGSALPHLSMF